MADLLCIEEGKIYSEKKKSLVGKCVNEDDFKELKLRRILKCGIKT